MHTNEPREVQGIELGYDPRDIEAKGLTKAVIYFFLFTLFFFGVGAYWWINAGWSHSETFDKRKPAVAGPLVQGNMTAKTDIMSVRQHEREMMTTYAPLENGKWRIPVDQAIEKIGGTDGRGLPAITSDAPATSPGTTIKQNATGVTPGSPGAAGIEAAGHETGGATPPTAPVAHP
jgi:hypothetical protein